MMLKFWAFLSVVAISLIGHPATGQNLGGQALGPAPVNLANAGPTLALGEKIVKDERIVNGLEKVGLAANIEKIVEEKKIVNNIEKANLERKMEEKKIVNGLEKVAEDKKLVNGLEKAGLAIGLDKKIEEKKIANGIEKVNLEKAGIAAGLERVAEDKKIAGGLEKASIAIGLDKKLEEKKIANSLEKVGFEKGLEKVGIAAGLEKISLASSLEKNAISYEIGLKELPLAQLAFHREIVKSSFKLFKIIVHEAIKKHKQFAARFILPLKFAPRLFNHFRKLRTKYFLIEGRHIEKPEFFGMFAAWVGEIIRKSEVIKRDYAYTKATVKIEELNRRFDEMLEFIDKMIEESPVGAYINWKKVVLFPNDPLKAKNLGEELADQLAMFRAIGYDSSVYVVDKIVAMYELFTKREEIRDLKEAKEAKEVKTIWDIFG